jgi:Protein of unknown function (DUF1091)
VIYLNSIDWKVNPKYGSFALMNVWNDTKNISRFNFNVTSTKVLKQFVLFYNVKVMSGDKVEREGIKATIDMCKLTNGTLGNYLVKYVVAQMKDKTNFKFICPIPADTYYVRNFGTIGSFVPRFLIPNYVQWSVKVVFKGKVGKTRSMDWFGEYRLNGSVTNTN